jgi:hypothetical protein
MQPFRLRMMSLAVAIGLALGIGYSIYVDSHTFERHSTVQPHR